MSVQLIIHRSRRCENIVSKWLVDYIITQIIHCTSISNYFNWAEGMIVGNLNNTVKRINIFFD